MNRDHQVSPGKRDHPEKAPSVRDHLHTSRLHLQASLVCRGRLVPKGNPANHVNPELQGIEGRKVHEENRARPTTTKKKVPVV